MFLFRFSCVWILSNSTTLSNLFQCPSKWQKVNSLVLSIKFYPLPNYLYSWLSNHANCQSVMDMVRKLALFRSLFFVMKSLSTINVYRQQTRMNLFVSTVYINKSFHGIQLIIMFPCVCLKIFLKTRKSCLSNPYKLRGSETFPKQ